MIDLRAITAVATLAVQRSCPHGRSRSIRQGRPWPQGQRHVHAGLERAAEAEARGCRHRDRVRGRSESQRGAVEGHAAAQRIPGRVRDGQTHAPSGSFSYHRVSPGAGRFVATATRAGERCSASATV